MGVPQVLLVVLFRVVLDNEFRKDVGAAKTVLRGRRERDGAMIGRFAQAIIVRRQYV